MSSRRDFSEAELREAWVWFLQEKMPPGWGWKDLADLVECVEDLTLRFQEARDYILEGEQ